MNYLLLFAILISTQSAHASQMSVVEVRKKILDATLNAKMYGMLCNNNLEGLKNLFAQETIPDINDQKHNSAKRTPLIGAVRYNKFANAQTLIDLGADVNLWDMNGDTALVIACREWELSHEDATKLIQLLVLHGASETGASKRYPQRAEALANAIAQRKEYNSKVAKEIAAVQEDFILDVARIVADYSFEKVPAETEEKLQ